MKPLIRLADAHFPNTYGIGFGGTNYSARPANLIWDRTPGPAPLKVFTDGCIKHAVTDMSAVKVAVMIDSPVIRKVEYDWIAENYHYFDKVLTFKRDLVERGDPFEFYPLGGSWIPLEEWGVYKKWRSVSMLVSEKTETEGHRMRHELAKFAHIEPYGMGVGRHILDKGDALKDYRFAVIIENAKEDYFWSEKLQDALSVGTIPIYWGPPDIGNFFNLDGIITFDTVEGARKIILGLTKDFYEDRIEAVKENLELARQYRCPDDIIYHLLP